jgi:serine/threonine protein phosphatase PrpC
LIDYAYISECGNRDINEDSYCALDNEAGSLFVVADGLGGHSKGEVASSIVTDTFASLFKDTTAYGVGYLTDAFVNAQNRVLEEQSLSRNHSNMSTTCAALLIADDLCHIGHIGDTRVYLFNKNKVKLRTLDHSVPQMLVISGDLKEKKIRNHPDRNRLLRAIGTEQDTPRYELAEPANISECQAFLLCTDGFWELCTEKKMCSFLKKSKSAREWLDYMKDEVIHNGRNCDMDNFTAIAIICRPGQR